MTYFYHAVVDSPHLPRDIEADSAQSAIITLLGELWPSTEPAVVPSAALVSLLDRIGVSESATRAALSRMSRRGTLDVIRDGRQTSYRLSDDVAASIPASERLTMEFGATDRPWNGEWTVVVFSMPESQRDRRQTLRDWLRWLGFGPVRDGVWISPHADIDLTQRAIRESLPDDGLVFRSAHVVGEVRPADVWPLDELAATYTRFVDEFRPYVYELRAGTLPPAEAMRLWIRALGRWRGFPTLDPDLPASTLPAGWPRAEARRVFEAIHDGAGPIVAAFVRTQLSAFAPVASTSLRALSADEARAVYAEEAPVVVGEVDLDALRPAGV